MRGILVFCFAVTLLAVGGLQPSKARTQESVSREPLIISKKIIKAFRQHRIDPLTLVAAVKAARGKNQVIVDLFAAFEEGKIDASTLVASVTEAVTQNSKGDVQIMSSDTCTDFADGYEIGCMLNGGSSCGDQADAMYCACRGGTYLGGGFCLSYS